MSMILKSAVTGSDAVKTAAIATQLVEGRTGRFFGRHVWSIGVADGGNTEIQCPGHGLIAGDKIVVSGSNSMPTLDGTRTVLASGLKRDSFSVALNVTSAGTEGFLAKVVGHKIQESHSGRIFLPMTPVRTVNSIAWDTVTYNAEDYELVLGPDRLSWDGKVRWIVGQQRLASRRGLSGERAYRTYTIEYVAGCHYLPQDIEEAVVTIARQVAKGGLQSFAKKSESIEDYSWTAADGAQLASLLPTNVISVLNHYKAVV